ncbi:MAG: Zn-ribbon domain-containing OB-fold protein [Albimonas sp.]|uniref:Zn-ribbon domain-containing OB-fold protein n=1 Tax=Albimonas sp. TaxID=1872425 RepID=UPI004056999B|tara:strand:+ start:4596 stop:5003 length:408 start_codon:yes stop_codon:yes gene_type:complete
MTKRFVPTPSPETRHYWDGAKAGELRLQRCLACAQTYFPPRPFCPECGSREVEVFRASGKATLHSYIINHIGAPGREPPFAVAIVELAEGPRLMSNILDCEQTPAALTLDMPLEVTFETLTDEIALPQFKPAKGA